MRNPNFGSKINKIESQEGKFRKNLPKKNIKNSLLLIFYFVIRIGAGKSKEIEDSKNLKRYLLGVRILILILALVGIVLWLFL